MHCKRLTLAGIGIIFYIDEKRLLDRIRSSFFTRYLIRPAIKALSCLFYIFAGLGKKINPKAASNNLQNKPKEQTLEPHHLLIPKELLNNNLATFTASPEQKAILGKIEGIDWYHSIPLGHGVVTPGAFDHRPYISAYHLPERLDGMSVLDVATFDGFWAFEFEKRGATKVVALDVETVNDLDLPPSAKAKMSKDALEKRTSLGFETAKEILGSKVHREILSIYDLSPERLGKFDMVFCSDLLLHLMNPNKALQNIYHVVSNYALIVESFDTYLDQYTPYSTLLHYAGGMKKCLWWIFSKGCLEQMIRNAGFRKVELLHVFKLRLGPRRKTETSSHHAVFRAYP